MKGFGLAARCLALIRVALRYGRTASQRHFLITYKTFFGPKTICGSPPTPDVRCRWLRVRSRKIVKPLFFSTILRCQPLLPLPPCWGHFAENVYFSNTCPTKRPPEHPQTNNVRRCRFRCCAGNAIKCVLFYRFCLFLGCVFGIQNCKLKWNWRISRTLVQVTTPISTDMARAAWIDLSEIDKIDVFLEHVCILRKRISSTSECRIACLNAIDVFLEHVCKKKYQPIC